MPEYVYGCPNNSHPRVKISHAMSANPEIKCSKCGKRMHRVPQPFRFSLSPGEILRDWLVGRAEAKKRGDKQELYNVSRPERGLPQKDFHTRS